MKPSLLYASGWLKSYSGSRRLILRCVKMSSVAVEPREVRLSVPWGHVAGRAWGDPQGKPVLAVHGWLDNAGSFDALLPLMSKELYVVAVDWPGHGFSSHIPPGSRHSAMDYLEDIRYIVQALKWDKFSFLAHSMGGGAASWYTAACPEQVETLVALEGLGFWSFPTRELPAMTGKALSSRAKFQSPDTKTYSNFDTVLDRIVEGHAQLDPQFDRPCAEVLAKRGVKQLEDGSYQFTRDRTVIAPSIVHTSDETNAAFVGAISTPTLVIVADKGIVHKRMKEKLSQANSQIKVVSVSGGHHVHLQQPKTVHSLVESFLLHQTVPPQFTVNKL